MTYAGLESAIASRCSPVVDCEDRVSFLSQDFMEQIGTEPPVAHRLSSRSPIDIHNQRDLMTGGVGRHEQLPIEFCSIIGPELEKPGSQKGEVVHAARLPDFFALSSHLTKGKTRRS